MVHLALFYVLFNCSIFIGLFLILRFEFIRAIFIFFFHFGIVCIICICNVFSIYKHNSLLRFANLTAVIVHFGRLEGYSIPFSLLSFCTVQTVLDFCEACLVLPRINLVYHVESISKHGQDNIKEEERTNDD